ncbi:GNAT family N-acetyltransferase [Candidatus Omnitrophota bacterium]
MDVEITGAGQKDFAYIQEKIKKYLLDATNLEMGQFYVAKAGGKVAAFGRIIDFGEFFEIASLGVDYYQRKRGFGKQILTFLVQEAGRRDIQKPIYGVTHVPEFVLTCGFVPVESGFPDYLDYKRKHLCHLHESRIKVVKWQGF